EHDSTIDARQFALGQIECESDRVRGRCSPWDFHLVVRRMRLDMPAKLEDSGAPYFDAETLRLVSTAAPHSYSRRVLWRVLPMCVAENQRHIIQGQECGL